MYLPSGEYMGVPSLPGLVVIFFAVPPATGTMNTSLLVLVACTSSMLLVKATSCHRAKIDTGPARRG